MMISYLLLGGNLGNRERHLAEAREAIRQRCGPLLSMSNIYETEAWGLSGQAPYLNQALEIETALAAPDLLEAVLDVERQLGRIRDQKYGPRTIDIDILFYGKEIIRLPHLSVPHPFLHERRFALVCLQDIAPHLVHPLLNKTIQQLLAECSDALAVHKF